MIGQLVGVAAVGREVLGEMAPDRGDGRDEPVGRLAAGRWRRSDRRRSISTCPGGTRASMAVSARISAWRSATETKMSTPVCPVGRVQVLREELLDRAPVRVQPLDARRHERGAHGERQQQRGEDEEHARAARDRSIATSSCVKKISGQGTSRAHERGDQRRHVEIAVAARGDDDDDLARGLALGLRDRIRDAPLLLGSRTGSCQRLPLVRCRSSPAPRRAAAAEVAAAARPSAAAAVAAARPAAAPAAGVCPER